MKRTKLLLLALALCCGGLITGCVGLNRTAYNAQKTSADLIAGAGHGLNLYLAQATNQVTGADLAKLLAQRDAIYADIRKAGGVEQTVTAARLAYKANSADTNKTALNVVLGTFADLSTTIVAEAKQLIGGK